MPDTFIYLLYLIGALVIGLLGLPVVLTAGIALRRDSSVHSEIDLGVLAGALGARIQLESGSTRISAAMFRRVLPWPTITRESSSLSRTAKAQVEVAVDPETDPERDSPIPEKTGVAPQLFLSRMRSLFSRIRRISSIVTRPALRLLMALFGAVRIRELSLSGRVGFSDPAQTGRIFGLLMPLTAAMPGRIRLDLRPDFTTPSTSGHAKFVVHVYVGYIILLCLKFGLAVCHRWIWMQLARLPARIGGYLAGRRANAAGSLV